MTSENLYAHCYNRVVKMMTEQSKVSMKSCCNS